MIDLCLGLYERIERDLIYCCWGGRDFWKDRARYHVEVAGASVSAEWREYDWRTWGIGWTSLCW